MRISYWSSDVCSSDLLGDAGHQGLVGVAGVALHRALLLLELVLADVAVGDRFAHARLGFAAREDRHGQGQADGAALALAIQRTHVGAAPAFRSEEHTSELQSLMRISYAVFCLKKKTKQNTITSVKLPKLS